MPAAARPQPLNYQREDVVQIREWKGRALVGSHMGTGKTPTALWYIKKSRSFPTVIVCPASLKWNWEAECLKFLGIRASVLSGRKPPKEPAALRKEDVFIINYDILPYWTKWLAGQKPQILVMDEAHYVSNRASSRSKACRKMAKICDKVLALSGTPLTNRPAELWHILHMIRPDLYPGFLTYARRYCDPRKAPWGWEFKGASHMKELHRDLKKNMMIRRRKEEVLKDLPAKTRQIIPLPLSDSKEYKRAKEHFLDWLAGTQGAGKSQAAKRAVAISQMGQLKQLAARLKAKALVAWVNNWFEQADENEKLVMFGVHHKMLDVLERRIDVKSVRIDGNTSQLARKQSVQLFQNDDETRLFIGQIRAAGVGLNLTRASTVAFAELDWTPGVHEQAEDRIHRIGQENAAMIYYLLAHGTIEEELAKIIQRKQKVLSAVLDGGTNPEDIDIFTLLAEALEEQGE